MASVSAIGNAIDAVKKLAELSKKIRDADVRMAIADLQIALADVKMEVASLKEENLKLESQLKLALSQPDIRADIEPREGVYYLKTPPPGRSEGPYCPRCFDVEESLVMLNEVHFPFTHFGKWKCSNCKSHFGQGD